MRAPKITRIRIHQYAHEVRDLGGDYNGFNLRAVCRSAGPFSRRASTRAARSALAADVRRPPAAGAGRAAVES